MTPLNNIVNPMPHIQFYRSTDGKNRVIAATQCHHSPTTVWVFYLFGKNNKPIAQPMDIQSFGFEPCETPAQWRSGAELVQALHPWGAWHKFMQKVDIPDQYTGKLKFYLEYELGKAGFKEAVCPNASKGIVVAVLQDSQCTTKGVGATWEVYTSMPDENGREVPNNTQISRHRMTQAWIQDATTPIDEKTARIIHPALFDFLSANNVE